MFIKHMMTEHQNGFCNISQKDAETEDDLGESGMLMRIGTGYTLKRRRRTHVLR
jgi:hypothetical protein